MNSEYSIVKNNKVVTYQLSHLDSNADNADLIALSYDYKNTIFPFLSSKNNDDIGLEDKYLFKITKESVADFPLDTPPPHPIKLRARVSKQDYLKTVNRLKEHIQRGDIYEVNYCMEFYAEDITINPTEVFYALYLHTEAPHNCFLKIENKYLICGSPERFIKKEGRTIISQPIKGTRKRGTTEVEDEMLIADLKQDTKERSENIMITDLVRNDLSHIAKRGTVSVDELCEVYTFKSVHQLISTVSCEIKETASFQDIINATFPMGSMTGAPKISAMELIEKHESTKRGLYSGTVGLLNKNGDFDLNVVIRSILYNEESNYLSIQVGSAITINSNPEAEYEECLIKLQPMLNSLNATIE